MTIWVVMDGDYDGDWIVAAYESEALAKEHGDRVGLSHIVCVEVLTSLSPEAIDTRVEREVAATQARLKYQEDKRRNEEQARRFEAHTINDTITHGGRPGLCHCETFTTPRITTNGCCRSCHRWTPGVYRAALGEDALIRAIDLLAHHDRVKMRTIYSLAPQ